MMNKYLNFFGLILFLFVSTNVYATVFEVSDTGDAGANTLRQAIIDATADNTSTPANPHIINFNLPANSTITLSNLINISDTDVDLVGTGMDDLTIDGGMNNRIFEIQSGATVTLSDMTLQNGLTAASGGALTVETDSVLTTNRVLFTNNTGEAGGAIRAGNNSIVTINFSIFESNIATANGGAISAGGESGQTTIINNSIFRDNVASNQAMTTGRGGAIFAGEGAMMEINNSVISGNGSVRSGSGISITGSGTSVEVLNSTLSGNVSGTGGAINNNSELIIGNTIVALNISVTESEKDIDESSPSITLGGNLIGDNTGAEGTFPSGLPNGNNDFVGTDTAPIDPLFVENVPSTPTTTSTGGNLRLQPISIGINNGVNSNAPEGLSDLDGNERIQGLRVEIGAFEIDVPIEAAPTMSEWSMFAVGLFMLIIGFYAIRRKSKTI